MTRLKQSTLLLILVVLSLVARPIAATNDYEGLDIIFVIDQSASMARLPDGALANDPFNLRFYAPWYAMYWLGEDRLLIHEEVNYRMAIVNFGSDSNVEVWDFSSQNGHDPVAFAEGNGRYWQDLTPDSRQNWEPIYDDLTDQIQTDIQSEYSSRDLGTTKFVPPFEVAQQLFDSLPSGENHRRVIIVLTDGQPSDGFNTPDIVGSHMEELRQFTQSAFPEPQHRIYTISMNDQGSNYWPNVVNAWETITNDPCNQASCPDPSLDRAGLVANNDDVGRRFQEILQDLTSGLPLPDNLRFVDVDLPAGDFVMPPYLESVQFTYFKDNPANTLVLNDETGVLFNFNQPGVDVQGVGGPIEAVRIANPQPGQWTVSTNPPGPDVDITMRQIFAQSRLDQPTGVQGQYIPLTVQYALLDEIGGPLPSYADPQYRLIVEATISAGGQSWPLTLTDQGNNIFTADFTPIVTGQHTISVHAESRDLNGTPIVVFDGPIGNGFTVSPATFVPLNVPSHIQQFDSDTFSFELQDNSGFPISSGQPLSATLTIDDGTTIPLVQQADGTYQATHSPQVAGMFTAHAAVTITDVSGQTFTVFDGDVGQFTVSPTLRIALSLIEPQETELVDTELWPLNRTPTIVQVELRDETGRLVDPAGVFTLPDTAITLTATDADANDVSDTLQLQRMSAGVYRAETTELGMGTYDVAVQIGGDLEQGYLYSQDTSVETTITRIRHPLHLPIAGGSLLTLILLFLTGLVVARVRSSKRRHPCTGRVVIVDAEGIPQFQQNLATFGRNKIEFTSKQIQNPMLHVSKLVFVCDSQKAHDNKQVKAEIYLDNNSVPISKFMGPASEQKLGQYNFWLLKDPTDDQMMLERGGGGDFGGDSEWDGWGDSGNDGGFPPAPSDDPWAGAGTPAPTTKEDPWANSGNWDDPGTTTVLDNDWDDDWSN